MEGRELFFKVCRGERPEEIPFVPDITDWYLGQHRNPGEPLKYGPGVYIPDDDEIKYERGIGIPEEFYGLSLKEIHEKYNMAMHVHIRDWYEEYYSDDVKYSEVVEQSHKRITYTTKKGVLHRDFKLAADGSWCSVNYLMDGPEDFPILFEILKATRFRLREGAVDSVIRALGTRGQGDLVVNRSPFGKLLHEYLGFEKITYLLFDDPELYKEYEKIQTEVDMELIRLAAQSSCSIVLICDHADATLFSPQWYADYCIPFYRKAGDVLRAAGKLISTHVDGNLKNLLPLMKDSGFDILDGCTPAPAFDYEPEELAEALGEKMCAFVGVPFVMFCDGTPVEELYAYADRIIHAFKGKAIVNVGDILPVTGDIYKVIALNAYIKKQRYTR